MGLFNIFKRKDKTPAQPSAPSMSKEELLELVEVSPERSIPRAMVPAWPQILATALPFAAITATHSERPDITGSHFGYYPRLPIGYCYPLDEEGNYLYPLAQINLGELPPIPGMPASGYLQFYIGADEVWGIDFDDMLSQKNSRVLFFEESEVEDYQRDFSFLDETLRSEYAIIPKPKTLSFTANDDILGVGDIRYTNGTFDMDSFLAGNQAIEDELTDFFYDNFTSGGHKVGGYAYFTQEDPRHEGNGTDKYVLLLQVDSDDDICWGDVGVANFFIHPDDLARKDFSKVMYTWDCS